MPNKRRINLSLSDEVVDRLSQEDNMSRVVEQELRDRFDID
jgi:hypothetical protein